MRRQIGNGNAGTDTAGEAVAILLTVMVMIGRAVASLMLRARLTGRCGMHGKPYRGSAKKGERGQNEQKAPGELAHGAQCNDDRCFRQGMFRRNAETRNRSRNASTAYSAGQITKVDGM